MKKTPESSPELLERLVDSHHEQLFRFAFFRIGSQADAEDVVQEAYLRLASCDLTRIANPKAYLFRTVANGCCDLLHRKTRLRPLDRRIETVDDEYDAREEYERIEALLRELPEEQADVIRLHTAGALRFTEIAELLDRPVSTVKSRFRYGIDRLRHSLNVFDKSSAEPNAVRALPRRETDEKKFHL